MVVGELDFESAGEVERTVSELRAPGVTEIVLDLRQVDFIDSAGLRALLALRNAAKRNGLALTLVSPEPAVLRLFEITGTRGLFDWKGDRGDP